MLYTTYPRPPGDFIDLTEKRYSRFSTANHKPVVKLHKLYIRGDRVRKTKPVVNQNNYICST